MALSMDEQRMLAEIERRLSAEDPRLAARLSSFRRPGPAAKLRSPRGRIIGSLFTIALVAVVSMMVYTMVPFRAHGPKTSSSPQASSPGVSASAPAQPHTSAATTGALKTDAAAKANTPAKTTASSTSTNSTRTSRTPATRTSAGKTGTTGTAGTTASHSSAGSAKTTGGT